MNQMPRRVQAMRLSEALVSREFHFEHGVRVQRLYMPRSVRRTTEA